MWDVSAISKKAQSYLVISFDIFDTLIKRDAGTPEDIFEYTQCTFNTKHSNIKISNFSEKRIIAEKKARSAKSDLEVTIAEIYKYIDCPNASELMKIEMDMEIKYCVPNKCVVDQYNICRQNGQRLILTSDMYLSRETIEQMLNKCGIYDYEKLYLSSEIGKKKSSGELYLYLIQDLGVNGRDVLHIGDSKTTDNIIPRRQGMGSFYVRRHLHNTEFLRQKDVVNRHSFIFPFINNHIPFYSDRDDSFKWGYETLGPVLLGFCSWVRQKAVQKGLKKIYFLARDMNLVHQIYKEHYFSEGIVYLEISRKSLRKTYVRKKGRFLSVLDTMTRRPYTLKYLLTIMGFSSTHIENLGGSYNLSQKVDLNYEPQEWFADFDRKAMEILYSERDYAEEYLRENGLFDLEEAAIVDIGWHGTIQNMLEDITGKPFYGFYFGITKRSYFSDMKMEGYWFSCNKESDSFQYISIISILETMLFAQIGTTIGYRLENEHYIPIYNHSEMTDFSFIHGFQQGAMQFVKDCMDAYGIETIINSQDAVLPFTYMAFSPTLRQVGILGNLPYEEERIFYLVKKREKYKYLLSPASLICDYDNSRWKTGFIKWMFPFIIRPNNIEVLVRSRRIWHT